MRRRVGERRAAPNPVHLSRLTTCRFCGIPRRGLAIFLAAESVGLASEPGSSSEMLPQGRIAAIFVLEVNPNPDSSDECEFWRTARASGRTNQATICEIVERAIEREQSGTKT